MTGTTSHSAQPFAQPPPSPPRPRPLPAPETTQISRDVDHVVDRVESLLNTCLPFRKQIEALVRAYYDLTPTNLVPGALVMPGLMPLAHIAERLEDGHNAPDLLRQISRGIVQLSSTPIHIEAFLTPAQFPSLHHDAGSMRLESIGLLCAIAGRSSKQIFGCPHEGREVLVPAMFECTSACLRLAHDVATQVSDMLTWLGHEHLQLTLAMHGDSHPHCWRFLGDLATDVTTAGFHREATSSTNTPFFLAECRRKTFAACYKMDKVFATSLDRPPRLSRRFADCHLPLDLGEDVLMDPKMDVESVRPLLTPEGWSLDGQYHAATWLRIRYIFDIFREEVLEVSQGPAAAEKGTRLREISDRSQQSWAALPSHLQYTSSVWDSGVSLPVCLTLIITKIAYLQTHFLIHNLLQRLEGTVDSGMLEVSTEILAIMHDLGLVRDRAPYLRHDFIYLLLAYGLPAAAVLSKTLRDSHNAPNSSVRWPRTRPQLIRSLTVFVSYLDSVSPSLEADGKRTACQRARDAISRTLDEVLEGPRPAGRNTVGDAGTEVRGVQSGPESTPALAASFAAGGGGHDWSGPAEMSFLDGDVLTQDWFGQDFDLSQWPENAGSGLDGGWTMDMS